MGKLKERRGQYLRFFILVGVGLWAQLPVWGQVGLSFKENKGQWDPAVLYRAELPDGYIYLRSDGLTYNFLSDKDLTMLREGLHGSYQPEDTLTYVEGPKHKKRKKLQDTGSGFAKNKDFPLTIHGHAYMVDFLGADKQPEIVTERESDARFNYLIGDKSKWGHLVRAFEGLTYKALYPGIDMHLYSDRGELKYDLILQPNENPGVIKFRYRGAEKLYLKKKQLYIETSVGTNRELEPYAYQIIDNNKVEVKSQYVLENNVLSFNLGNYNKAYPLIIDPNFIFSSFSGSEADNWGYTATYDAEGNLYMGGIVFGTGYPSTPGAYQELFAGGGSTYGGGGFDIGLSKLSSDGKKLIYATYLGGSGDEQPHSLVVNQQGKLIISGRTNSSNFPGKKVGDGGGWDMILAELSADGSNLDGALVIGGTGADGVNIADKYTLYQGKTVISLRRFYGDDARSEVNVDKEGNIYLVGSTQSQSDFPVTSGTFQSTFGGGLQDAVVIKAKPDLSDVLWVSFLGGEENDAAYVLSFALNGDLYVAGGTESNEAFPGMNNTYQTQNNGRVDGFISRITADGRNLLYSTYVGTSQADQIYGLQVDDKGAVYAGGTTEGVWKDVYPGVVQFPDGRDYGKQFFIKFSEDLSRLDYTATFASSGSKSASLPNISPTAFLVDRCENVYMSGWGGQIESIAYPSSGTNGLPKVNSLNLSPPDGHDFYFFVMKKDAKDILYADTYGQNGGFTDHVDGGTSRFDPNGVIYQAICANCGGGVSFPTGPRDVYSPFNGSLSDPSDRFGGRAGCNVLGFKIAFNLDGTRGGIKPASRRSKYCNDEEIKFVDSLIGRPAKQWIWEAFDADTVNSIFGPDITDVGEMSYEFSDPGKYVVRMIKYNPGDCIEHDTSYTVVRIGDNPVRLDLTTRKLAPCEDFKYEFVNHSTSQTLNPIPADLFTWNFGDGSGDQTFDDNTVTHSFGQPGSYNVSLLLKDTSNFCNTPLDTSVLISASFDLKAGIEAPDMLCSPGSYPLNNISQGGTDYEWIIKGPDGTQTINKKDASSVFFDFNQKGEYDIKLIARDSVCDQADSASTVVLAYPKPKADFQVTSSSLGQNPPINAVFTFKNLSESNFDSIDPDLTYQWFFGDGGRSNEMEPSHLYNKTGTYEVTLVVSNAAGCADTASMEVEEEIIPALDVPSAFTPGAKDINGFVGPRAFGVEQIDFKVYNRWGELVFHSTDPDISYIPEKGWDGTYQGKQQEMDAYAYVVHAVFVDGTETTKKGSITLIR